MQIQYTDKIEKYFEDFSYLQKKIGKEKTKTIKKHIDNLKASNNFGIFLSLGLGKPHPLSGNHQGEYGIRVTANERLIVEPVCENLSIEMLKICDTIIIKGVEDYHGSKENWLIP